MSDACEVAVVGGGPAGLMAAIAAAEAGASVRLIDEWPELGGQLRYRVALVRDEDGELVRPGPLARRLARRASDAGVRISTRSVAWSVFSGRRLGVAGPAGSFVVEAGAIVLAAGSIDLPLAFPGSTLPGVMTKRALQILLHVHRVRPGQRFAVIGDDDGELANDLRACGCEPISIVDGSSLRCGGEGRVQWVANGGPEMPVDGVVLALGRQPDAQLAWIAEAEAGEAAGGRYRAVSRNERLETTAERVFVAGDAGGITDVAGALREGRLAGRAAASAMGYASEELARLVDGRRRSGAASFESPQLADPTPHLSWKRMTP